LEREGSEMEGKVGSLDKKEVVVDQKTDVQIKEINEVEPKGVKVSNEHEGSSVNLALQDTETAKLTESKKGKKSLPKSKDTRAARKLKVSEDGKESLTKSKS
jgi:hypothetical protein